MWCKHCRQDVPALPSADQQTRCCPRCGETICAQPACAIRKDDPEAVVPGTRARAGEPFAYDNWETDEQLRHIERVLQGSSTKGGSNDRAENRNAWRLDAAHAAPSAWHAPAVEARRSRRGEASPRGSISGAFTWSVLSLGTMSFVCGGILLGWSLWTGRQELWTIGLPTVLVGQIALLIGLVLQLDRLWHDNRAAAVKLDDVDEQLHNLKATTTLLGTSQGPGSSVFYSHFANGAGPQLLLTDLKSQLDLLALKIAQEQQ